MNIIVTTRPTRTSDEISNDRKAAAAFYARMSSLTPDDIRHLSEELTVNHNLLTAHRESSEWNRANTPTAADRRANRAARLARIDAEATRLSANRDETHIQHYLSDETRALLPAPRTTPPTPDTLRNHRHEAAAWTHKITHPSPTYIRRVTRERQPAVQWYLTHLHDGPVTTSAPAPSTRILRTNPYRFIRGQYTPIGMTPERALQIALDALETRGGSW